MKNSKWNSKLSITLSSVIIKVVAAVFFAALFFMPYFAEKFNLILSGNHYVPFLVVFYFCAVFAFTALWFLDKLIKNIRNDKIFIQENVKCIRILSWCCFIVALACFILGFSIFYMFVISCAAAFFGLILRVLKNVFDKAVKLQEENDYTI